MTNECIQEMMSACCLRRGGEIALAPEGLAEMRLGDGGKLAFEITDDALLVMRVLPQMHLSGEELRALLAITEVEQGWPTPVHAGLAPGDPYPLLLAKLEAEQLEPAGLERALDTLEQAYRRWQRRLETQPYTTSGHPLT